MQFEVVTIFPELFESFLRATVIGKAVDKGLVQVHFTDPRDFTADKHRSVDDAPYGGGVGMVMRAPPIVAAIEHATKERGPAHRILLTPTGTRLDQDKVKQLAGHDRILLVCGRYEGVDDRVRELAIDEELSLGDFVLSGGEPAAMAIIDAVSRYVPGVLGEATSTDEESFSDGLLEHPQYTRPPEFRGLGVPPVLLSGDHEKIRAWRREQSEARTRARRPDLLADASLAARTYVALVHHPVVDRSGRIVTTAVTNLDIHDIARASTTFGLAGYFVVTPVEAQQELVSRILGHWAHGAGREHNDKRTEALTNVRVVDSLAAAKAAIPGDPLVVATGARPRAGLTGWTEVRAAAANRPLLLVFGTGWGLAEEVFQQSDHTLPPIKGGTPYNHLSVRSAVAIVLDRLFGNR